MTIHLRQHNVKHRIGRSSLASFRTAAWVAVIGLCLLQSRETRWTARAQGNGLVAAYGFDEGAGTIVADSSGNGNTGTITGATWATPGMYGGALRFDGTTSGVTVPDAASLDLTTGMTLEAWVFPTVAPSGWSGVIGKDVDRYCLMAGSDNNTPAAVGTFTVGGNSHTYAPSALAINNWTHVAATFDGAAVRFYISGVQVAMQAQTGELTTSTDVLTIGHNVYGERFTGLIDEVRVYNRALTATEIQTDMGTPVSGPAGPRLTITQPAAGATLASTTVNVVYAGVGDLTGVDHVHFRLDSNPEVMDLSFDGAYQFTGVPGGAHTLSGYLVRADHSAIPNTNASVNFTTTVPDIVPPTVSIVSPTGGATVSGVITVSANASDDVGVAGVQFRLDGNNVGAEDLVSPYSISLNTTLFGNRPHSVSALARDLGTNSTLSTAVVFTISNTNPNDPAQIGQWSAPFSWPIVGLHAALLPTGKVLSWADHSDGGGVQLWNPAAGTFRSIPYASANLFCAGQTILADGRLLVNGGHVTSYVGIRNTTIFDPWSESWVAAGSMTFGRWYPTSTVLGDGRVLTVSGGINCPNCSIPNDPHDGIADIAEIYNPATNLWSQLAGAPRRLPIYPHMFLLPDGRVFASSAFAEPSASAVLNLNVPSWTQIGAVMDGGSAAMYAPGKIIKSGSAWNPDYPVNTAVANTHVIDINVPSPAWRQTPSMAFARTEHDLTLLPDGSVLATGGSGDSNVYNLAPAVFEAELWSPTTETWRTMARMDVPRLYHSNALLLPDARVLVEGGGTFGIDQLSGQIYSPPYLFKGARPVITSAPASASYGSTFTVQTPDAARIGSVTAMALGSVTHAFDANQRIVRVSFKAGSGSINATLPTNVNAMPPGYYMLFLVDTNGVPSVSTMLRVTLVPDTAPPTAPSSLVAAANGNQVTLNWTAATDNVGVTGYRVERCQGAGCSNFAQIATTTATPTHLDAGLAFTASYSYRVRATDATGLLGPYSNIATATTGSVPAPPPAALVAAYGFDESNGSTVTDASGNTNTGTISGATRTPSGKFGSALSFNGTNARVTVPDSTSLDLTNAMTIEAWVSPSVAPTGWRAIIHKDMDRYYLVAASDNQNLPAVGGTFGTTNQNVFGTAVLPAGIWTHLSATYDRTTIRLYVNGIQVAAGAQTAAVSTSTAVLTIGADYYGEYFTGLIDEVRIYNRALTVAEIQTDMGTPVSGTPGPRLTITQPAAGAIVAGTTVNVAYTSTGDQTGVDHVHFQLDANPEVMDLTFDGVYQFTNVPAGLHTLIGHLVRADHSAIANTNASVSFTTTVPDTTPPTAPGGVTATPSGTQVTVSWTAATDNVGVTGYRVERCQGVGCTTFVEIGQTTTALSYVNTGVAYSTSYSYRVRARDAAALLGPYSNVAAVTTGSAPSIPPALVAAYGFNEGMGTTAADRSGNNNTGTVTAATWNAAGHFGGALEFDGTSARVTVADSASLDLTNAFTLEAWVRPSVALTEWRSVITKDVDRYFLMASSDQNRPAAGGTFGGTLNGSAALAVNAWTHLAATYDRTTLRLYVNGVQVASSAQTAAVATSNAVLTIGANTYGEYFEGLIDDVRIYNRALTSGEIQTDMVTPVQP